MKVEIKPVVVLTLTENEADWLRSALQNPIGGGAPDDERPENRRYRERLFEVLNSLYGFDGLYGIEIPKEPCE